MNLKQLPSVLVVGLACLAPLAAGCRGRAPGSESTLASVNEWINVADTVPTLESLHGQPVVVEFWATWCGPCVKSVPHLVELHEKHAEDGLTILGIHAERGAKEREQIERFVERNEISYPIGLDVDGGAMRSYGVSGIPRAFVYDRDGELVWEGHPLDPRFDVVVGSVMADS